MTLVEVVIALAITSLTVAGIVEGYIYCTNSTVKESYYLAANGRALERLEQTRSAQWDNSSYPPVDQLVATNFPDEVVTLNKSGSDPDAVSATLHTDISQLSTTPAFKRVRVDCIWQFRGQAQVTNTIETLRAPSIR